MKKETLLKLNNLNKKFYSAQAASFDATRQTLWPGWERVVDILEKSNLVDSREGLSVLDVGCGNGRYLKYLIEQDIATKSYLGVDSSEKLIEIAKKNFTDRKSSQFEVADILEKHYWQNLNQKFNHIVAFGLFHHIPGYENRLKLVQQMIEHLNSNGTLVITFWQFMKQERFQKMIIATESHLGSLSSDLEENDYLLDWDNSGLPRYCHYFSDEEVDQLIQELSNSGIQVIQDYNDDGKDKGLNKYLILSGSS